MNRQYYLDLAAKGLRFPIGTDLILREKPDHEAIVNDGRRLGQVVAEAADRYQTPLAFPLMDLMIEKAELLALAGMADADPETFQFNAPPDEALADRIESAGATPLTPRLAATVDAIRHVAQTTNRVPVGMCIGPFSLMTRLIADPITAVYIAGSGATADDDPEVLTVERVLDLALRVILRSIRAQVAAGAKAICVAEPAANIAYFSPNQYQDNPGLYERYAMHGNRAIAALLAQHGVDMVFHCCGELIDPMVKQFASLDPAILSLGSSRKLWDDAALVPQTTVLYGNLPSKKFYSDEVITTDQVRQQAQELLQHMQRTAHPFILGSECDVLSVRGCEHTIQGKVKAMLQVR